MLRAAGAFLLAWTCLGASAGLADDQPFDVAIAAPAHGPSRLAAKWQDAQRRMAEDKARLSYCRAEPWACSEDERRLEAIVALGRAREGRARIGEINRAVNLAIRQARDEQLYDREDYWANPLQTLTAGAGDCEDYAILKILALQELGVAPEDLQLLIVRDRVSRNAHAVAAVRLDGRWLILDNRGFVMVDLAESPYSVLAQLDTGAYRLAARDAPAQLKRDVM
jgi:predicted transglutaminase-like cysteine proteinase